MTDINGFVRLSQRNPQRDAGLARVRQRINAERLKVAWMSEEEKSAHRLQEPPEPGRLWPRFTNPDYEYEPQST
jgi:hypothetical protein